MPILVQLMISDSLSTKDRLKSTLPLKPKPSLRFISQVDLMIPLLTCMAPNDSLFLLMLQVTVAMHIKCIFPDWLANESVTAFQGELVHFPILETSKILLSHFLLLKCTCSGVCAYTQGSSKCFNEKITISCTTLVLNIHVCIEV